MSRIDRSVSNHEVIPVVASTLFSESPTSRLACGMIAVDGTALPGFEAEYAAHFHLRRKVYVDQTGQLSESELLDDGTDRDSDDARSITFAVFENHTSGVRVLGVARLIVRGEETPLPVEDFCPDVLAPGDLSATSVEVSRVIARHETAAVQNLVQIHLFALMLAYLSAHGMDRTFAILEPWLERHVKAVLVIERIGEVRYVEHYLDYNLPIEVDVAASVELMNSHHDGLIDGYRAAEPKLSYFGRARRTATSGQAA